MVCSKCLKTLNEGDVFCPHCGKRQQSFKLSLDKKVAAFPNIVYGVFFILLTIIVFLIIHNVNDKKNRTYDFLVSNMTQSITSLNFIASDYYKLGGTTVPHNLSMRKMLQGDTPNCCSYLIQKRRYMSISSIYQKYIDKYQKNLSRDDKIFRLYDLYDKTIELFDSNPRMEKFKKEYEYLLKEYESLYGNLDLFMRPYAEPV